MEYQKISDSELLYLYHSGDEEAFNELVRKYKRVMMGFVNSYRNKVRTSCELADIYQIALIALHHSVETYNEEIGGSFESYYRLVGGRMIFNRSRYLFTDRNRVNYEAYSYDAFINDNSGSYFIDLVEDPHLTARPDYNFNYEYCLSLVNKVLDNVSDVQRLIFSMWISGFSYEEIMNTSGLSKKKIDNELQSIKRKIRSKLTNE